MTSLFSSSLGWGRVFLTHIRNLPYKDLPDMFEVEEWSQANKFDLKSDHIDTYDSDKDKK